MKAYIYILIILLLVCCVDKKTDNLDVISTQKKNKESIQTKINDSIQKRINDSIKMASLDTIFRKEKDFYLKIHKLDDGFLKLDYKLKNEKKEHSFTMRYFEYSENIFPMNGVGHLDSKNLKLEKYFIYKDSILILPVLNIPNELSLYLIDLKNEENLVGYFRTSLLLFWISTKNGLEIVSAKAVVNDDAYSSYKYTLRKCRLNSKNYLEEIKVDSVVLKYDINTDLKKQYEIIKKF